VHGHLALSFVVSDSGIGIPKQAQEKLFEDYVQADASTTRQYGGTGLGLAIVKQLSGLMGGRVELQSEDGQGSTFTVVLPGVRIAQADEVPGPVESFDPQGLPELRRERLLVVEDNPTNQIVALGLLRKIGYRDVTVVGNGQEAVDEVAKAAFNVILMDCQMPVMDGYTATRALRATGCATPIIAMTANALEGDIQRCLDSGMDAYLSKPLDHVTMLAALVKWRAPAASNSHALESTPSLKPDGESSVATFDASSALERLGGDASLLATVLGSFVERLPAIMQELAHSVEQRDSDSAGRALHSLVGTGDAVSARAISLTVRKMAEFLKTGDWVSLADALLVLKSDFDDFSGEVARSPYRAEPAGHRLS
jgi:CheY-like chemotaxis protein/HPt (histidine-containing phosphotransfer) domain-containing protein